MASSYLVSTMVQHLHSTLQRSWIYESSYGGVALLLRYRHCLQRSCKNRNTNLLVLSIVSWNIRVWPPKISLVNMYINSGPQMIKKNICYVILFQAPINFRISLFITSPFDLVWLTFFICVKTCLKVHAYERSNRVYTTNYTHVVQFT